MTLRSVLTLRRSLRAAAIPWLGLLICLAGCGGTKKGPEFEIEKAYSSGACRVKLGISKKSITVAQRLTLVLEATADKTSEADLPHFGETLGEFSVTECVTAPPQLLADGSVVTRCTCTLEPFLSGEYKIPPLAVSFREKGPGASAREIRTDEVAIRVISLLPSEGQNLDIRDIAKPEELPLPLGWKTLSGIAVALLLSCALAFYLAKRRRGRRGTPKAPTPAHEVALAELEKLLREKLVERGEVKAFYARISGILRRYIEDRFGLRAPECTTEEFLAEAEGTELLEASHKVVLGRFLSHCDLVKFAEHRPSGPDIEGTVQTCREFVEVTRQRPEEGEKPASPQSGEEEGPLRGGRPEQSGRKG